MLHLLKFRLTVLRYKELPSQYITPVHLQNSEAVENQPISQDNYVVDKGKEIMGSIRGFFGELRSEHVEDRFQDASSRNVLWVLGVMVVGLIVIVLGVSRLKALKTK